MFYETIIAKETATLAFEFAKNVKAGDVISLIGDLGVGKTVFTQGFAKGLEIEDYICSPTFTIMQVYDEGRLPLYHFDVYRISDLAEMDDLGYEEYFYGEGVCLVEWANLIEELMPEHTITITIEKDPSKGFDYRRITIGGKDEDISN